MRIFPFTRSQHSCPAANTAAAPTQDPTINLKRQQQELHKQRLNKAKIFEELVENL